MQKKRANYKSGSNDKKVVNKYNNYSRLSRWRNPIQQMEYFKFTYAQAGFLLDCTTVSGNKALEYFSGNSLYDPYYSGGGVQPYGLDQYCPGLYQLYKVYASKITVYATLKQPAESTVESATITVYPTIEGAVTYDDIPDVRRMPKSKSINLSVSSKQIGQLSNYATTSFIYPNMTSDSGLRAQYNANPSNTWRWIVHGSSQRESQPAKIYFDVRIEYYTILSRNTGINES